MIKINRHLAVLCTCLLIFCFFGSEVIAADTSGANKYIIGHYRNGLLYSPVYQIENVPVQRLTHLIYQSAIVTSDGVVDLGDRFIDVQKLYLDLDIEKIPYAGNFAKLAQLKQRNPHLKVLISIGKWGDSKNFSQAASTEEGRQRLASSCIDFMQTYGFDGIDIYWQPFEFNREVLFENFERDRKYFVAFVTELRTQMKHRHPTALLSATLKMAALIYSWPTKDLSDQVDFINLSAAYFHGAWEDTTNHISPIYDLPGQQSVDAMLQVLLDGGVPANKVILDIVTYGQARQGIPNINNGLYQHANAISLGSWDATRDFTGLYSRNHVKKIIAMPGYTEYWDDGTKTAYAFNPNRYSGHFISYENERSIDAKIDYVKEKGLLGVGILDMHNDEYNQNSLLVYIHKRFYFLQHLEISLIDFVKDNRANIIDFLRYVAAVCLFLILIGIAYARKKYTVKTELHYFDGQKNNLLSLEWGLIQLIYLTSYARNNPAFLQISQVNASSVALFQAITQVVSRSSIRHSTKAIQYQALNLLTILMNVKVILNETKKNSTIIIESFEGVRIQGDYMLLTQMIYRLCVVLCVDENRNSVHVSGLKHPDGSFVLQFSTEVDQEIIANTDYFLLKEAYVTASALGLTLLRGEHKNNLLSLYFPNTVVESVNKLIPILHSSEPDVQDISDTQSVAVIPDQQFTAYFSRFSSLVGQDVEKAKDAGKLIEWACESFLEMNNVLHIQAFQSEQQIGVYGSESTDPAITSEIISEDLKFIVYSPQPLRKEESLVFDVLISQVQLVRKALKGLAKDSKLLNELHYLSANHDRVLYIQADEGYSFVHLEDEKQPKLLSLTMRAIKYFFDDDIYLQVHRSCIVNPDKVKTVQQANKMKFEIVFNKKKMPLSRVYVAGLKMKYPHWFSR